MHLRNKIIKFLESPIKVFFALFINFSMFSINHGKKAIRKL